MNVVIVTNKRRTEYTPAELQRDARRLVKGKGKLRKFYVAIDESGGQTQLIAWYLTADGVAGSCSERI